MALQSHHLEAFLMIARLKNFSKAAVSLHVTQSALSHRIAALEEEIAAPLFIREKTGVRLTELGEEFLRYVQLKNSLEEEFLSRLSDKKSTTLKGVLRVGTYASIGRSIVLKALTPFLAENPGIQLFFMMREMRALPDLLKSGEADFIFLDYDMGRGKIESKLLGEEEYALVEAKKGCVSQDVYLNHDEEDLITFKFYEKQGIKNKIFRRSYLDEIYSCIDGVGNGMGMSVLPIHLVKDDPRIKIHAGFKNLKMPVYLHYFDQPVRTEMEKRVTQLFEKEISQILK
ncbi:MAG: LysR family transcriptional regulator [Bdellovibrionales bacterium]|nr:LysR family transcriptional regulator [Oligoflexia bacterium]